ncbi:MAG TPA: N-acetyl-gamma-glutamyl-phosphate reductase [Acidimicrobiales bacterium]
MISIGIVGASGFTGAELLRLCAQHPELDVRLATGDTQVGTAVADLYPSLAAGYPDLIFTSFDADACAGLDLVFLGLPHGASQAVVPQLVGKVGHIVDLAADFRLSDASLYPQWYGDAHSAPELLGDFAYGLPELFRAEIASSDHVAVPGCYPTAANLALAPLVRAGAIELTGIIVDAASGASGAGRPPKPNTTFCTIDEDFTAYGLLDHRHTPEIEQVTGASVLFTPHLAPMSRGILATCYARPTSPTSTSAVLELLRGAYADEPFVVVIDGSPSTKATLGSNCAHVTGRYDERTGWVVVIAAIDNLTKGASGQAVQCANIVLDLPETTGLPIVGVYP